MQNLSMKELFYVSGGEWHPLVRCIGGAVAGHTYFMRVAEMHDFLFVGREAGPQAVFVGCEILASLFGCGMGVAAASIQSDDGKKKVTG
ncbi:MAG: hypothetical protein H8E98_05235 [Bacteroidetes bacterium]|nr:hypothetical protein [Bacteroidota bacterium]